MYNYAYISITFSQSYVKVYNYIDTYSQTWIVWLHVQVYLYSLYPVQVDCFTKTTFTSEFYMLSAFWMFDVHIVVKMVTLQTRNQGQEKETQYHKSHRVETLSNYKPG